MADDPPASPSKGVWEPTSKYWRGRAEEARSLGDEIRDPSAKATMQRIAEMYDRMADNAAKRENRTK
jgi:hypothetical protein